MSNTADQIIAAATLVSPGSPTALSSPQSPAHEKAATIKRGRGRPPLAKANTKPTSKLLRAKSQKRNLTNGSPKKTGSQRKQNSHGDSQAGPSNEKNTKSTDSQLKEGNLAKVNKGKQVKTHGPKISLIPAVSKSIVDFQSLPTPLP